MKKKKPSKGQANLVSRTDSAPFEGEKTRRRHKGRKPHRKAQDCSSSWKKSSSVASLNRAMLWGDNTFIKSSSSFPTPVNRGNGIDLPLEKHAGI